MTITPIKTNPLSNLPDDSKTPALSSSKQDQLALDTLASIAAQQFPKLTHVDSMNCEQSTDASLLAPASKRPKLTHLNLTGCVDLGPSLEDPEHIAKVHPNLIKLDLPRSPVHRG